MKVIDRLKQSTKTLFSFEIIPPLKGENINDLFKGIEPLLEFKPSFIDVTYHREEYVYKKHSNGLLERRTVRKRPGTVGICAAIHNKYQIDTVPHIICGGFTYNETENALIDLHFLGIDNVLVLRGDPIKSEYQFVAEENGPQHASDLIQQVVSLNKGIYLDNELMNHNPTNFCIGVAGYPEKHFEAPNLHTDMKHLKKKIDIGADYIVTQMFFDNTKYFKFVEACRNQGISVPIIPGLKPITSKKQLSSIPKAFYVDMPVELTEALENCKNDEEAKQIGIDWGIQQAKELIQHNVPCLHFYTMGRSQAVKQIVSQVF